MTSQVLHQWRRGRAIALRARMAEVMPCGHQAGGFPDHQALRLFCHPAATRGSRESVGVRDSSGGTNGVSRRGGGGC